MKSPPLLACALLALPLIAINAICQQDEPIKFETVHFARTYPGCGPHGKESCLSVQVDYPAIVAAPTAAAQSQLNATIQQHLFSSADGGPGPSSGDALALQLEDGYRDLQRRFPDYKTPWFDHRSATVLQNRPALFSLQMRIDQFTGGAHPNSVRIYLNLRPQSGETLSLTDVTKGGALPQLAATAEKHFREARKLAPDADLKQAGFWFKDGKFVLPENFGLAQDALIFYFNSYDIAPYYFGPTEVKIPYSEVYDLLRPEFLPVVSTSSSTPISPRSRFTTTAFLLSSR